MNDEQIKDFMVNVLSQTYLTIKENRANGTMQVSINPKTGLPRLTVIPVWWPGGIVLCVYDWDQGRAVGFRMGDSYTGFCIPINKDLWDTLEK